MSSTPRAKPMAGAKEGASPRASKPAAAGDKKPKAKKPKGSAPTAPMTLGMPMQKPEALSEEQAKADLAEMQKKYGTLVVTFNNQQAELAAAQKLTQQLEAELEALKASQGSMPVEDSVQALRTQLEQTSAELKACEAQNMALQKKVNKLQVEHVSDEEVDQLFYALEVKEQQLEQAMQDKESLEQEVLTARQLSARGGGGDPKFIEIHHHNDISDDEDDDAPAPAAVS